MTPLIQAVGGVLNVGWQMITAIKFPGSEMPIALILTGAFVIGFGIRILAYVLRMTVNVGGALDNMPREKNKLGKRGL